MPKHPAIFHLCLLLHREKAPAYAREQIKSGQAATYVAACFLPFVYVQLETNRILILHGSGGRGLQLTAHAVGNLMVISVPLFTVLLSSISA